MTGAVHYLKTTAVCFDAVERGEKTFEVRRNDRLFQKGDTVVLERLDTNGETVELGRELQFRVGWILPGGQFGIEPGYVVFALEETPDA